MALPTLLTVTAIGAAVLALWFHVRWPGLAPSSFGRSVVLLLAAFAALQIGVVALDTAVAISSGAAVAAFVGVIVPVLSFAFLAALWLMKLFADALKGYV